jgi:hypothetical protein
MRNSVATRVLTGELLGLGQSLLKSGSNPASAIIRRTSEKAKLVLPFTMIVDIGEHFSEPPLLAVTDSWFGNAGLLKPVRQVIGERFDMLSRLRCNNVLYDFPEPRKSGQRGRRKKYGQRLGSATEMASNLRRQNLSFLSLYVCVQGWSLIGQHKSK